MSYYITSALRHLMTYEVHTRSSHLVLKTSVERADQENVGDEPEGPETEQHTLLCLLRHKGKENRHAAHSDK